MIRALALMVGCALLAVPLAGAATKPKVTISPANPYVDDAVKVTFTAPRVLKAGHTFDVTLQGKGTCNADVASKAIKPPRKKGARLSVRFKPRDEIVESASEWCQGKWVAAITEAKNDKFLRKVATKSFRFRAKP